MTRKSLIRLAVVAALLVSVHVALASRLLADDTSLIDRCQPIEVAIYAIAVWIVLRDEGGDRKLRRRAVVLILGVAALLRVIVLPINPVSTDINRYVWDGRVQGAGINPYLHVPADPSLKSLRDDAIYPKINRKEYAPTIYPPLAQIVFYLATRIGESLVVMKAVMVAFEGLAIWALMRLMRAREMTPTRILLYAWHPLPIWVFAGSGHVDAVTIACVSLALLAAELGRPILAGIAMGGAALTKYFPVIVGPAIYRRWDWKLPAAGLATILLLYLPYLSGGGKVFGFLSGYSSEEGYGNGMGLYPWLLAKYLFPGLPAGLLTFYMPAAALVMAVLGLAVLSRDRRKGADIEGAFALVLTFTVLTTPHYDWYMAWLVPFLCFVPLWSVIWLTGASTLGWVLHWPSNLLGGSIIYLPFFAILVGEVTIRLLRTKKENHGRPVAVEAG